APPAIAPTTTLRIALMAGASRPLRPESYTAVSPHADPLGAGRGRESAGALAGSGASRRARTPAPGGSGESPRPARRGRRTAPPLHCALATPMTATALPQTSRAAEIGAITWLPFRIPTLPAVTLCEPSPPWPP